MRECTLEGPVGAYKLQEHMVAILTVPAPVYCLFSLTSHYGLMENSLCPFTEKIVEHGLQSVPEDNLKPPRDGWQ